MSLYIGIKHRGDTAANFTSANPVLLDRQIAFETDSFTLSGGFRYYKVKIGDGVTAWNSLPYTRFADPAGGGGSGVWGAITGTLSDQTDLQTALNAKQPLDADLTTIAAINSTGTGGLFTDGAGWILKTYAAIKTALGLTKNDVGLGNVDNTSDANKPVSTATQTALDAKQNTIGYTPENQANKENTTLDTSTTKYPTNRLVKEQIDLKQNAGNYFNKSSDDTDDITVGATNKFTTAADITKLAGIEPSADVTDAGNVGNAIDGTLALVTPVDADKIPWWDSVAGTLKHVTYANLKSKLGALYVALTGDQTIAGVKTFSSFPVTPSSAPTTDYQVANKKYVDDNGGGAPGGSDTQVQYNNSGAFGGTSLMTISVGLGRVLFASQACRVYDVISRNGVSGASFDGSDWAIITDAGQTTARYGATGSITADGSVGTKSTKAVGQFDSTTRGFLIPRMTEAQRDAITSVPEGLEIYNLTSHKKNVYNGTAWKEIAEV